MKQLIKPNLNAKGTIGNCLHYARDVFGLPAKYPTAWSNWLATKYKHTDKLPNVAVPVWFSGAGGAGHVVVYVPRKGFYSSPWQKGTTHAVLSSISEIERIYHVKYVGWSEDLEDKRVAIPDTSGTVDDMYKGQTAKYWHDHAVAEQKAKESAEAQVSKLQKQLSDSQSADAKHIRIATDRQNTINSLFDKIKRIFGK